MPCTGDCNQGRECNCERKIKPHKWHKEIKAWADGAEIEYSGGKGWVNAPTPIWSEDSNYRIKPQPKEPQYLYIFQGLEGDPFIRTHECNVKCDTYIGKIKLEVQDD
jgi:hypothetical protein